MYTYIYIQIKNVLDKRSGCSARAGRPMNYLSHRLQYAGKNTKPASMQETLDQIMPHTSLSMRMQHATCEHAARGQSGRVSAPARRARMRPAGRCLRLTCEGFADLAVLEAAASPNTGTASAGRAPKWRRKNRRRRRIQGRDTSQGDAWHAAVCL